MLNGLNININLGDYEITRCPEIWIESERHRALTRMGIVLPDADRELFKSIKADDPVQISVGYRDQEPGVWNGTVNFPGPGNTKDQVEVAVVGSEKPLIGTKIIQTWKNETPESIVKWAVSQAGLPLGRIDSPGCVFPSFVASNISVWDVAVSCRETCQKGFDIDMAKWALWVDPEGKVNWGDFDESGDIPIIETGAGLIQHTLNRPLFYRNVVETFLQPGLRHSMLFTLNDTIRGVEGTFRALKVLHKLTGDKVRTFIGYGES